jgi:hypothetical protein
MIAGPMLAPTGPIRTMTTTPTAGICTKVTGIAKITATTTTGTVIAEAIVDEIVETTATAASLPQSAQ